MRRGEADMSTDEIVFEDREAFRTWLTSNHGVSKGIWVIFSKGDSLKTLSAAEALEEALCFGWIDGLVQSLGDERYRKRFTPRRKGSKWSEKNRILARKLIEQGAMTDAGLLAIDEAKKSGTWYQPKPEPITQEQVDTLIQSLTAAGAAKALSNLQAMPPSCQRTYTGFYLEPKSAEARQRRLENIIARLNESKKPMD
jgi:uncharacterized protein YdeI (YjbR/CyaY-like superfamily)